MSDSLIFFGDFFSLSDFSVLFVCQPSQMLFIQFKRKSVLKKLFKQKRRTLICEMNAISPEVIPINIFVAHKRKTVSLTETS